MKAKGKIKNKKYNKYISFANKIKSIRDNSQKSDNKPFAQKQKNTEDFDVSETINNSKQLMKEIELKFNEDDIKNKFWYKLIKSYSER